MYGSLLGVESVFTDAMYINWRRDVQNGAVKNEEQNLSSWVK